MPRTTHPDTNDNGKRHRRSSAAVSRGVSKQHRHKIGRSISAMSHSRRRATDNNGLLTPTGPYRFRYPYDSVRTFYRRAGIRRARQDAIDMVLLTIEALNANLIHQSLVLADFRRKHIVSTNCIHYLNKNRHIPFTY